MKLLSHIRNDHGIRVEETLKEHSLQTAKYASESVAGTGLEKAAYLAGLLHDMGKAKKSFMDYLEDAFLGKDVVRGSVNHTFAGVIYLLEKYHTPQEDIMNLLTSEILSCAIGGHHGIFDCADLEGNNGFIHRLQKDKKEIDYDESVINYFSDIVEESVVEELFYDSVDEVRYLFEDIKTQWNNDSSKVWFQISMVTRLLQSAVIYGDRRDTREFMTGEIKMEDTYPEWGPQCLYFEEKLKELSSDSDINKVRTIISDQCLDFSSQPCGIYRLDVPTGAGKTLASLRYALNHAEKFNKKRIIYIIPLLSVLDQNAQIIKDYISDQDMILEHHSNVIREFEDEETLDLYEILTEDWHSPIIISTLVQFLNILFKDNTSSIERMQALCDSVIIIDEVQSLPVKETAMFNMALNFLNRYCHATILLSSATLPSLDMVNGWPLTLASNPDIVHLNKDMRSVFRRSVIIDKTSPYGMTLDECAEFCKECMQEQTSVLLICNTKKEARVLYESMQEIKDEDWHVFHLSTSMCQAHRIKTLKTIEEQLKIIQGEIPGAQPSSKVICISTQLVEAGVDVSFECVIRVLAGIDNLAQAAGRCNRSNEYPYPGKVYLINLKNENLGMLSEISRTQDSTRRLLESNSEFQGEDLIEKEISSMYYEILYQYAGKEIKYPFKACGNTLYMTDLLANKNEFADSEQFILRQPFKTVGKMFQVFEDDTVDVLVPYEEGRQLIDEIISLDNRAFAPVELNHILEHAKRYTINIFEYQKNKLEEIGLLYEACDGRALILDESAYHEAYGLGDVEEPEVEHFIL